MQCKSFGAETQQLYSNMSCLGQEEINILSQLNFMWNFDKNVISQAD